MHRRKVSFAPEAAQEMRDFLIACIGSLANMCVCVYAAVVQECGAKQNLLQLRKSCLHPLDAQMVSGKDYIQATLSHEKVKTKITNYLLGAVDKEIDRT